MKNASISAIKKELQYLSQEELVALCLRLGKFKQDNKGLLTYILFKSQNEDDYIAAVKETLDDHFSKINTNSYFYMKKTIRKVLRQLKLYSRYSHKTSTEVELLLYFCERLNALRPSIHDNKMLSNLYQRQLITIKKKINGLHEDLQYDYNQMLQDL